MSTLNPYKVVITGAQGQVGRELQATAPSKWHLVACGSRELDVTQPPAVRQFLERERPALVIHAAAYTDVDGAEGQADKAEAVNAAGAANVADGTSRIGARLIHISTDFVFDGRQGYPYSPDDEPSPLGVYGRTKVAGEREVTRITGGAALVVRTAWVYSQYGHNFVHTMLELMSRRESVGVVCDQVGTPTWGRPLGAALWRAAECPELRGILHWTDAGVASWYDFAVAIQEEALGLGLLPRAVPVRPLRSEEFPAVARRPLYSVLDKTTGWAAMGGPARHWRENLRLMLKGLAGG
ncbi:MAG: dTDP-4-dehydrorhamnose reductase [Gemmatimonadales bacterium]